MEADVLEAICDGNSSTHPCLWYTGSMKSVTVSEGNKAVLPCLHVSNLPVKWSRYDPSGALVFLLDQNQDGRVSLDVDGSSLVVLQTCRADTGMYLCQGKKSAYLQVGPKAQDDPDASEEDETEDTLAISESVDHWKIAVGVLSAVVVVMALVLLTQRKLRSRRTLQNHGSSPPLDPVGPPDRVYEDVQWDNTADIYQLAYAPSCPPPGNPGTPGTQLYACVKKTKER